MLRRYAPQQTLVSGSLASYACRIFCMEACFAAQAYRGLAGVEPHLILHSCLVVDPDQPVTSRHQAVHPIQDAP